MRLQGIIDANVMGGISKYQEAFFTDNFLKSAQGHGQQANVQKLKCLILEQIQVLETALELHGQLAPAGVQPLHNRLLERFSQLRQSLSGMGRLKRQHSESIVNTPLPPLPTETQKRTLSLGGNSYGIYEHDEIYTRPGDTLRPVENLSLGQIVNSYQSLSKENLSTSDISRIDSKVQAPPIPNRPKSTGFVGNIDSPEVPPKTLPRDRGSSSPNAPPLPPRGITPDKRASNPPFQFNEFSDQSYSTNSSARRQGQKYSVVDISFDEPEADFNQHLNPDGHLNICYPPNDFRDSGISTSSNDLNQLNNLNSIELTNHQDSDVGMNINNEQSINSFELDLPLPPPIPPKSLSVATPDCDEHETSCSQQCQENGTNDGYITPKNSKNTFNPDTL